MVKLLIPILCAITGTQALWLAVANVDYPNNAHGGGIFNSPYCQVGKGNTREEAASKARIIGGGGISIIAGGHCDQLYHQKTNQLGGFWNDYGTINYIDDNWHWYCDTGVGSKWTSGQCDAGNGAPRKKREVEFEA